MFNLWEIGNQSGRPVHLYEFTWGNTIWRYTSADRNVTWGLGEDNQPLVWTAIAISDDGLTQGPSPSEFTVTLPANLPLVGLFRSTPPSDPIWLRCKRYHRDDPDVQAITYFVGTVGNVKRQGPARAEVLGLPISAQLRRTGLRLCWERSCPHMLYDQDCKVDKTLFRSITTITALTGNTITVNSLGAFTGPQFAGGYFEWEPAGFAAGTKDRRGIESFITGKQFAVFGSTDRLVVGDAVTLYLGCDLSPETCNGTFNNLPNHGGFNFMPGKSPFDGTPVF